MSTKLDQALSVALTVAALAIGSSVVYRTFIAVPERAAGIVPAARKVKGWESLESLGYSIGGNDQASVRIVVFSDLECPACSSFHRNVRQAMLAHPNDVKFTFVSHPLDYHKFAMEGARATDCVASTGGNVSRWIDLVFSKQDSLGLKSWGSFADEAQLADSGAIASCASGADSSSMPAIREFEEWADRLRVSGTPTVLINGLMLGEPPGRTSLDSLIRINIRRND